MQIDLEKILVHANEKLTVTDSGADPVEAFKRFLKIETERLRRRHRFGLGGGEIASVRSYIVDLVVCRACQLAAEIAASGPELSDCAVVALGGYGRRELSPFSDVDLLFLHAGRRRSRTLKSFNEEVLHLLWDMGLAVGHSFRSVSECVAIAKDDLHSRNAMAEARLVTGNAHLFRRLVRELDDSVFKSKRETDAFLEMMRSEMEGRYEKFGRTVCLQEPNVKETAGGLRDLHTVLWVGHARHGCRTLDDLRAEDYITGAQYAAARRAYDFVSRVRNEAHFSTGRMTDLLTLDLQAVVASGLGYEDKRGLLASELFMRDYYQRANELHRFSESFLVKHLSARSEKRRFGLSAMRAKHTGDYVIRHGRLQPRDRLSDFQLDPPLMLDVFAVAQEKGVDLSDDLKLAVRNAISVVDRGFRARRESGLAFVNLLHQKGRVALALRSMHDTGFLGRFLPEFGRIAFLVQHDFYHKYTIDEHTLKAVEALDQVASSEDPKLHRFAEVLSEVEDAAALYLGLFLHDIGKGHGGGHVAKGVRIAERVAARLGLDEKSVEKVIFLVRHHLLMSHLSQRRDLSDENVVDEFVQKVGDLERLNMLLLLTYADTSGVGPGVWNDWKATLLWELYSSARSHFDGLNLSKWDENRIAQLKQEVILQLEGDILPSEAERHFALMPERYLRATAPEQIVRHLKMAKELDAVSLVCDWTPTGDRRLSEVTVCTRDCARLIGRIAGTLTAHGIDILSADVYTREDGIVIDTFKVNEKSDHHSVRIHTQSRVRESLEAAIEGRYDVGAAVERQRAKAPKRVRRRGARLPAPASVRFDSETSSSSTVIEVRAEDELGLVYKIASTLSGLGLNITFAKIATEKNHALDIFYVTDSGWDKLSPAQMPVVEQSLLNALGGRSNSMLMKEAV